MKANQLKVLFLAAASWMFHAADALAQPVITNQPSWQTNAVGSTAMFSVGATGAPPLFYQWRFGAADRPGATNATLVLTNVQTANQGNYTVVITNVAGAVTSSVARLYVITLPTITQHPNPTNQSVSLGASVTFTAAAASSSFATTNYQWRIDGVGVQGKTNAVLLLTNVQVTDAGEYTLVVSNIAGSVTSRVARLTVDSTFTKITTGRIVTDIATTLSCNWGDFDNDGFLDLFLSSTSFPMPNTGRNFLYRNNRDGTFSAITSGSIVTEVGDHTTGIWGDFDNDGLLDLFVTGWDQRNSLFRNLGNGTFANASAGSLVTEIDAYDTGAWGDYDGDGLLDLFLSHGSVVQGTRLANFLYRNNGNGSFARVTNGNIVTDLGNARGCAWADFDNDGKLDLFVANAYSTTNSLYRNRGDGAFSRLTAGSIATELADSRGCVWGDYDNDGDFDLFVANGGRTSTQNNFLYRNDGDGGFTKITSGNIVNDGGHSSGCGWGDYDNDGFLDLFVANIGGENNLLYHNNGAGSFAKITRGSLVNDGGESWGCAWGDYDNDGFLDLVVGNGGNPLVANPPDSRNFLYRNNTNSNSWISLKLAGTVSNRSAIGAKVRLKAFFAGAMRWQLRQISGGEGYGGQNGLRAHFGLGDATAIDSVRIEWPSGTVQELTNVAVKQILTVTEPARLSSPRITNGVFAFAIKGGRGIQYGIQSSSNVLDWVPAGSVTITNLSGAAVFFEPVDVNSRSRFYRAVSP